MFFHIYDLFSIPYLTVIFVQANVYEVYTAICIKFTLKLFTHVYIYKILMPMVVDSLKIYCIFMPYFLLHIYDPFSIPCLAFIFFLQIPISFTAIHKISHLTSILNYMCTYMCHTGSFIPCTKTTIFDQNGTYVYIWVIWHSPLHCLLKKVSCIWEVIQAALFHAQRQLHLIKTYL